MSEHVNQKHPAGSPVNHVDALKLEQLAERGLPPREAAVIQAHIDQCARCNAEYAAVADVIGMLTELPRFAPSDAFANAVMARVRMAPAESAAVAWIRKIVPHTRRGWVLLATAAVAPAVPILAIVLWLITQPLVTPAGLWQWTITQTQAAAQAGASWVLEHAMTSGLLGATESLVDTILTLPTSTVSGFLAFFGLAIPLSAWGLVHLTRTPVGRKHHAS